MLSPANQGMGQFFEHLDPYCPPIYRCPADPAPNGVNFVFADEHLVFISDSIDRQVWRDFGSRASTNVGP